MNPWYGVLAVAITYLMLLPLPSLVIPGKPVPGGFAGISGLRPPMFVQ